MNLFRNLLFWLLLALVGALAAQLLVQDPGQVLVRFRGMEYEATVFAALLGLLAIGAALWLAWAVFALPMRGLRRHRERQGRARLVDGLTALHEGQWSRAERLLDEAARQDPPATLARYAAARAAQARGDATAARAQLEPLAAAAPALHALAVAEHALEVGDAPAALRALDAPAAQPLPPRGVVLRARALAALHRAGEAYGLLGALRQQQALPEAELDALQAQWAEASLREAVDANVLAERWDGLSTPLKARPAVVAAYADRAAALRWDEAAARSIEQALGQQWDEGLAARYGRLPIGRLDERRAALERWQHDRPASPGLLLSLARIQQAQGQWPQAEALLHRAIAQGAGAEGWEALGAGLDAAGDAPAASQAYANALRVQRGEPATALAGRGLRQQIQDAAAVEDRDEHGMPRLRQ